MPVRGGPGDSTDSESDSSEPESGFKFMKAFKFKFYLYHGNIGMLCNTGMSNVA